jgi:hypothetical protein
MKEFYSEQIQNFGLGNFINITPTLKELSKTHKVVVWFANKTFEQCYIDCDWMTITQDKRPQPRIHSGTTNFRNTMADWEYCWSLVFGNRNVTENTYIDTPDIENPIKGKYGIFINGAGSEVESYLDMKLVDNETQELIKELSPIPVYGLGGPNDQNRNIFDGYYGDIRLALRIMADAEWIITNATGLYHAAGALNKKQLVLWKDCLYPKNINMNDKCITAHKDEWKQKIKEFYEIYENE